MSIIKPFQGYLPPSNIAMNVSSPPYDVLSSEEAREIAQNNPDSFLRIIKPEIDYTPGNDPHGDTLHQHAAENLQHFISTGKLQQDEYSCFYLYAITMGTHTQTGIMTAVSVLEYNAGLIKKHEFTQLEKEDDRTRHIEITNANTGPVFLTFRNDGKFQNQIKEIKQQPSNIAFQAADHTIHELWKISDPDDQASLSTYFHSIPYLYIADGHHRAASASRVQKIRQGTNPHHIGNESYNFFLAVIFPHNEMQILNYNRIVIDLNGLSEDQLLESIKSDFLLTPNLNPLTPDSIHTFSMFLNKKWYSLESKEHIVSDDLIESLDASILQNHLLNPILDIEDPRTNKRIDFVGGIRGLEELERRCNMDAKIAFALHPVSIEALLAVADAGRVMPPKSTWFEPKLRSGLVVRLLD